MRKHPVLINGKTMARPANAANAVKPLLTTITLIHNTPKQHSLTNNNISQPARYYWEPDRFNFKISFLDQGLLRKAFLFTLRHF